MKKIAILIAIALPATSLAATLTVTSPVDGSTVSLLSKEQKAYFDLPRAERRAAFTNETVRKEMRKWGFVAQKVRLAWACEGAAPKQKYAVEVICRDTGKTFFKGKTSKTHLELDNFEIARTYDWKVTAEIKSDGKKEKIATKSAFKTEDRAPRLVRLDGVPNMRDIGGRTGLDRRRVKQGMIYRSAGLNSNACKLYTEKEVRQMYKDGTLLSEVPEKSRKAAAKIKAALDKGEKTDLRHLVREWIPGKERLNDASRAFAEKQFGIKTDIDLRTSDRECFGMTGSPLGPNVRWINISSSAYGGMSGQKGREAFTKVFKIFLDSDNYPIDFHCIAGADRTGAVAAIIEGLLGVDEEEIWKDWETTAFYNTNIDFAHHRIDALMSVFAAYEGDTLNKRIEGYVLSLGFTADDIAKLRSIMLE